MGQKPGIPKIELDWDKLDSVLQYGVSCEDAAELCGCSTSTIAHKIKEKHGVTFKEYRQKKMSKLRRNILAKQYDVAMAGSIPMLIWLGKQHLSQSDKSEIEADTINNVVLHYKQK